MNVTQDPSLRERVLSRELFTFSCPACDLEARIVDPLLYHDMDRGLLIHLVPEDADFDADAVDAPLRALGGAGWEAARSLTTRVVRTPNELIEKVLVFEAGLDDRVLECLKLRLELKRAQQFAGEVFFERRTEAGALAFVHLHEGRQEFFEVTADAWREHVDTLGPLGPGNLERWPRVDRAYAQLLYRAIAPGRVDA